MFFQGVTKWKEEILKDSNTIKFFENFVEKMFFCKKWKEEIMKESN